MTGGPSKRAVAVGTVVLTDRGIWSMRPDDVVQAVLEAAHDPALGLGRSVRLGEVVAFLREAVRTGDDSEVITWDVAADELAREFGEVA